MENMENMENVENMKKKRKKAPSERRRGTLALLVLAAVLLAASALGSTRAALTYFSEDYIAQIRTPAIGVTLVENGKDVSTDGSDGTDLLTHLPTGKEFKIGQEYQEELTVRNSGTIEQYVRVTIIKSWKDQGNKVTTLKPELIDLNLAGNGWIIDEAASTRERTVAYYSKPLGAGKTAPALTDTIRIDNEVLVSLQEATSADGGGTGGTAYQYDGVTFSVEAEADAVQTHSGADAIKSAWGVDVSVGADGSISL